MLPLPDSKWSSNEKFREMQVISIRSRDGLSWKLHGTRRVSDRLKARPGSKEGSMSRTNVIAIVVIVVVLAGGAAALYRLDTGEGARTSQSVSAKAASD